MPGAEGVPGSCHALSGTSANCADCHGDAQSGQAPWKGTTVGRCGLGGEVLLPEIPSDSPVLARLAGAGLLRWLPCASDTSLVAMLLLIGRSTWTTMPGSVRQQKCMAMFCLAQVSPRANYCQAWLLPSTDRIRQIHMRWQIPSRCVTTHTTSHTLRCLKLEMFHASICDLGIRDTPA